MTDVAPIGPCPPDELPSADGTIVVGIGASAGGIRALRQFFTATPPDSGLAYVVILHLSPDHESNLAAVLQQSAPIAVSQVRSRVLIEPNHIYVVSPNNKLSIVEGHIEVAPMDSVEERRAPVDMFFRTLAEAQRTRAVAVILSGTGANGSMGMKRIKECGGICVVQEPSEADFGDMPRSAIATGLVDHVLPTAEMPARLAAYRERVDRIVRAEQNDTEQQQQSLLDILALLRVRTGHDFANYKRSTVIRRIERRIGVQQLRSIAEYARFLRDNRDEARLLLRDLLISVTNFFRDAEAWTALERHVIPQLFDGRGPADSVRAWVAGCATGEEAYSIAMLLAERAEDPLSAPAIQVFATDIDTGALAKARSGLYTLNDTADISSERLRRFFVKEGDAYRVRRELREMVLFAPHNVIKDPPFSHLDLICCRNLLIYLNRMAQDRILRVFHFALNPGGFLFLGNSESADDVGNLYVPLYKEHHIFQSRNIEPQLTLPPLTIDNVPLVPSVASAPAERVPDVRLRERMSYQELHQRLLESYAPPSVVVTPEYEILHLSDRAGRYLQFVGGEPSQNLLKVARPELRLELHSALYQAVQNRTKAEAVAGPIQIDGTTEHVRLVVRPVFSDADPSRRIILVLFEPAAQCDAEPQAPNAEPAQAVEPIARQLEEELMRVKLQLRATIEQYELQQEELKASNEELQAMNEELRSSSEELETSKEELQSLNEELTTVNQELKINIDELSEANNDTRNLMNSTDLATVFVDKLLRIRLFTPRARSIFNLIPTDSGRPLLDITHRLHYPELVQDIERVLDTLAASEREVESLDGHWYIARSLPYRTVEDRIGGVVLTFTDITERKRTEQALRESEERVRLVVESAPDYAILTLDTEGRIETWNAGATDVFGYSEQEAIGRHVEFLFSPEDRGARAPEKEMALAREHGRATDERWHVHKDGRRIFVSGVMAPLAPGGRLAGYTKIARDLTQRVRHEEELRIAREQLEARAAERTRELADTNAALRREIEERGHAEEMRLGLLKQVVRAQEDERRRISRELHDQLGQEVTALALQLAALKSAPDVPTSLRGQLELLDSIVKRLDSDVDFLVWELRPTGLDDLGLAEALSDYLANWSKYFGLRSRLDSRLTQRLPMEVETVLYRIAQEALNNVAKHAHARQVDVILERDDKCASLIVQDDGVGFDTGALTHPRGLGVLGMRERAALMGGSVTIESGAQGTTVRVRLPLQGGHTGC